MQFGAETFEWFSSCKFLLYFLLRIFWAILDLNFRPPPPYLNISTPVVNLTYFYLLSLLLSWHELTSQGFIMSSILRLSNHKTRGLWSTVQQNMPKNIFNFMIKYLNNTLATRKNLFKWSLSDSPSCSFCLHPETLQHVVSSCRSYLEGGRYTWRHNSVLLFIAKSFSSIQHCLVYADLPFFPSPSLITGDSLRPDLTLIAPDNSLYVLELTVGFETNIEINSNCKATKYRPLLLDLKPRYREINFVNISMGALGILESSSDSLLQMMKELGIDNSTQKVIIKKIMNIAVRCTYYVFCRRNKAWTIPELLNFWFCLVFAVFFFFNLTSFVFLFSIYSFCYCMLL